MLSGSGDGSARLWDVESGRLINGFSGHLGSVNAVAFSLNGERIITGSEDTATRVFDATTGELILSRYSNRKSWLAISAAGFFNGAGDQLDNFVSAVRGLAPTSLSQVHQALYNPDLLRELLAGDVTPAI